MPELPEVEVTRRGLEPQLAGRTITGVAVREARLRWRIPPEVLALRGRRVHSILRRAKYLLFDLGDGHLLVHLGMSGSLRILKAGTPPQKHDHFDLLLEDRVLRLRDPRRFGAVLWVRKGAKPHPLLAHLGVEPLSREFGGARLHALTRGRRTPIKSLLMDGRKLVGVGNIYASESLFRAGIDPRLPAKQLTREASRRLALAVKATLRAAIQAGGSSLRDFVGSDGNPGYFQQRMFVYDREAEPCRACGTPVRRIVQGQRATFFCPRCQERALRPASGRKPSGATAPRLADRRTSTRRRPAARSRAPASRR